ncbi:MAG TPA: nitroreductase [Anaerolineae bacterium]|nr:nitroreductase [Anaerolineae bacterium]
METLEAIHTRQSIGQVKPDPVPREVIEKILSAAVQAPNHFKVRPWRFVVMTGAGREKLGEAMAQSTKAAKPEATEEELQKDRGKPLRAPVVIAVAVGKPAVAKEKEIEDICATAAAVQNMLLAAHALGLAAMWRTGPSAADPAIKRFFGWEVDQHLLGFVYLGYPQHEPTPYERPSFEDRTVWID